MTNEMLMNKLQGELNHFRNELSRLTFNSENEHDRWYRGTLERLVQRRSKMLSTLFPETHHAA